MTATPRIPDRDLPRFCQDLRDHAGRQDVGPSTYRKLLRAADALEWEYDNRHPYTPAWKVREREREMNRKRNR